MANNVAADVAVNQPPSYPAIPEPARDFASLQESVLRLKENVELITGQRGRNQYSFQEGLTQIRKVVDSSSATILELNELVVTANSALAQRTTILEAEITNARGGQATLTARITQVDTARVNGDSALALRATNLEAFQASQGGTNASLSASISSVDQARIDGDNALASSINTVSTTVGSHTASISSMTSSLNGVAVRYGIYGSINGVTGGFELAGVVRNDGAVSYSLEINANVVINGDVLINGTISTAKYGDLSLATQKVQNNAINAMFSGEDGNNQVRTVSSLGWTTVLSCAMSSPSNSVGIISVQIDGMYSLANTGAGGYTAYSEARVINDQGNIIIAPFAFAGFNGFANSYFVRFQRSLPSSSNYHIQVQIVQTGGSGNMTLTVGYRSIDLLVIKK